MKIESKDNEIIIFDENISEYNKKSVVEFQLSECKESVFVTECCDYYYTSCLDKSDMDELITKLIEMRRRMEG